MIYESFESFRKQKILLEFDDNVYKIIECQKIIHSVIKNMKATVIFQNVLTNEIKTVDVCLARKRELIIGRDCEYVPYDSLVITKPAIRRFNGLFKTEKLENGGLEDQLLYLMNDDHIFEYDISNCSEEIKNKLSGDDCVEKIVVMNTIQTNEYSKTQIVDVIEKSLLDE